ncbi:Fur family transcriptional regulator [Candidatus Pelagibacter sp.]|jgi:Fur family zinc uptake transcriptional regulator|uniref:Fur family transcriptional regulator n=1 Tax=Candidatus Pelagibacter sp. TaxID=2024849 RepID=UPI003F837152|tara:strand:- start:65 stop:472 length:408 start_codon:yes stop_codon:yes gene_type:complete
MNKVINMKQEFLSKNQQIVLETIKNSNEPLKAYSILFDVKKKGIKAPPQVYRALDKLIEIGKIHKIESKNAFVACKNTNCDVTKTTAFSICEKCENIEEIKDTKISKYLKSFKDNSGMNYTRYNLELFGLCKKCK